MFFEVRNLDASYGDVQVLWDLSLQVGHGEIVSVIGPNGAGKSTLLKAIVGLLSPPRDGRTAIRFQGHPLLGRPPEEIVGLGITIVPEGSRVFPDMTVLDNLRMGSYIASARARRGETLEEVFRLFPRLHERQRQLARSLSGGERQMLAIGRALMSRPAFLLLDEPTIGLQPSLVTQTFETIRAINASGVTILLVEQNVFFTLETSHRAYVLENGRIVREGTGSTLLNDPQIKAAYLGMSRRGPRAPRGAGAAPQTC
jgi:branched-chain amino acid transport system ATP-binding protein